MPIYNVILKMSIKPQINVNNIKILKFIAIIENTKLKSIILGFLKIILIIFKFIQIKLFSLSIFKYIKWPNSNVKYIQLVNTIIKVNIFII